MLFVLVVEEEVGVVVHLPVPHLDKVEAVVEVHQ
jgi:hypothetical protein